MNKILIQYAVVAVLLSLGVFTLINYDVALVDWTDSSKFGWVLLTFFIYHNTTKQHRDE
jgi:hypothetical protein